MPQEDRLTLKKMTFTKSLRGYSCDEVDTYIDYVTDKYAQVCKEYAEVRRRLTTAAARESELRAEDEQTQKARLEKCQQSCDAMVDEAKRQSARILADAEKEARLIIRQAEDEAQNIAANAAKEGTRAQHEANRSIAAKNNLADRLVQEIDTFRKEVFALYAEHIDSLEHLGKMTDDFYQQKNELTDAGESDSAEMSVWTEAETDAAEGEASPAEEDMAEAPAEAEMPVFTYAGPEAETDLPAEEGLPEEEEYEVWSGQELDGSDEENDEFEDFAGYEETGESDKPEENEESEESYAQPEELWEEDAAFTEEELSEILTEPELWDETAETETEWSDGVLDETAVSEEKITDTADPEEEFTDTAELLRTLFGDTDWESAGETEDTYDDKEILVEDTDAADDVYEKDFGEDENDLLLADLKSIYGASEEEPDDEEDEEDHDEENAAVSFVPVKRKAVQNPKDLDDLFQSGEATNSTKDISLTGEFDIIFSNEKSMRNVEEIGKQPMVAPEAPPNPKKHSKF